MEEVLLPAVVPLPEHDVVPVGSVNIQVYLSDVRTVQPRYFPYQKMSVFVQIMMTVFLLHLLVLPLLFLLYSVNIQQNMPQSSSQPLRNTL